MAELCSDGIVRQDGLTAEEWLKMMFEFEWCTECGRDHRHHTVCGGPFGNFFARCDREPVIDDQGKLVVNPEGYEE